MIDSKNTSISLFDLETGNLVGSFSVSNVKHFASEKAEGSQLSKELIEKSMQTAMTYSFKCEGLKWDPQPQDVVQAWVEKINKLHRSVYDPRISEKERKMRWGKYQEKFRVFDEYCKKHDIKYGFQNIDLETFLSQGF